MANVTIPRFSSRWESDGYVVFVSDSGRYLYADDGGHEALTRLRNDAAAEPAVTAVRARYGLTAAQAEQLVAGLVEVLSGRRDRVGKDEDDRPRLCVLSDVVGDSADRCEMFGMPL